MRALTIRVFCLCLFFCFVCRSGPAQGCRTDYTFSYATYVSGSTDGTNIYTSVLTDGSGSGTPGLGCNYPNARHTANSYNLLGSTGGRIYGTPGYMTSYLSTQNNQQIVGEPGVDYIFDYEGDVICTVFGSLLSTGSNGFVKIVGANYVHSFTTPADMCEYELSCPNGNQNATCGQKFPLIYVDGTQNVCKSYLWDYRLYLLGTCSIIGKAFLANTEINCN